MPVIRKMKDNSIKMILNEPELFVQFLHDYVPIELLKEVEPSDIEDVTERFLTLVSEQKDGDTIKRIKLKGGKSLFVIAIVEHESEVNFRAPFKMLLYIALILDDYEKEVIREAEKKAREESDGDVKSVKKGKKVTQLKDFKYPPVLPIIFYDGATEWTAETNFLYKTELHEVFKNYIPSFEYVLVDLNKHSIEDIVQHNNLLSLFMVIDKIKDASKMKEILASLPEDYVEQLKLNVPEHLNELLANVARMFLAKINVPEEEAEEIVERIHERGVPEMFNIENYDVQETRRLAREEGREEGLETGIEIGREEGKIELYFTELGYTVNQIAKKLALDESNVSITLKKLGLA